ncbi:MAG: hypothetical protein VX776_02005, partial [Planctomycetota bacterium]|nr:hypothetical protein [Planctomycetota bacterium]
TIRKGLMSNSFETVAIARFQLMQLAVTTLEKIHDAPSVIAQASQIQALGPVFDLASEAGRKIKPTPAQLRQLNGKYGVAADQILKSYQSELERIMQVKGLPTQAKLQLQKMLQLVK